MNDAARRQLASDSTIGPLVSEHGPLELEPAADPFRRLTVAIIRQQVSMDAAAAIRERLFDAVNVSPEGILAADAETLEGAGLSAAKAEYVTEAARYFHGRENGYFESYTDQEVIAELTDIRGIGPWTAKMFLLFGLAREDVFPVEDLGIRKGMRALYDTDLSRAEMYETAESWRPYRSYAALYVWRGYEG